MEGGVKSNNETNNFTGLDKLPVEYKTSLFDILSSYLFIRKYLKNEVGVFFSEKRIAQVIGMVGFVNPEIEKGCKLSRVLLYGSWNNWLDYFDSFYWTEIKSVAEKMKKVKMEISKKGTAGFFIKVMCWIRFGDKKRILFQLGQWVLYIFLFLTILYFLVATDFGRDMAWRFLDWYGLIIKVLLVVLLVVGIVLITGIVSFMYLESKGKK